jgi:hypothetical protein
LINATGRILHDPKRFKGRVEPIVKDPLGKPPKCMKKASQREAWETFADELPWLNKSHRSIVGIASEIRGKLISGEEVSVNQLNLLRQCLGQLGATPSDASKVKMPDGEDGEDDPAHRYF